MSKTRVFGVYNTGRTTRFRRPALMVERRALSYPTSWDITRLRSGQCDLMRRCPSHIRIASRRGVFSGARTQDRERENARRFAGRCRFWIVHCVSYVETTCINIRTLCSSRFKPVRRRSRRTEISLHGILLFPPYGVASFHAYISRTVISYNL